MKVQNIRIEAIKPYERNTKKHPETQIKNIAESIKQFGFVQPLVLDKNNEIIIGHGRYFAAQQLEMEEVPCLYVNDLTEEQVRKLRILDNKLNESEWDDDLLCLELEDLDFGDFDVDFGLDFEEEEKEIIEDEVPEVDEESEPITQLGDIWQLGEHRLMCGDSTDKATVELLMNGNKADMVFTDPPYGMKLDTDYSGMQGNGRKGKKYDKVIGDNEDFSPLLITSIFENFDCEEIFLWGVDYYFDLIPNFKDGSLIVWDKTLQTNGDAGYNSEFELLWSKTPHKKEVIHFNWFRYFGLSSQDIKTREHPTQKPLQVITPYIERHSKENNIIVDVFGGSGSTLIACEQLNRTCYMMELDPKYCDVILKRYINLKGSSEDVYRLNADGTKTKYSELN